MSNCRCRQPNCPTQMGGATLGQMRFLRSELATLADAWIHACVGNQRLRVSASTDIANLPQVHRSKGSAYAANGRELVGNRIEVKVNFSVKLLLLRLQIGDLSGEQFNL